MLAWAVYDSKEQWKETLCFGNEFILCTFFPSLTQSLTQSRVFFLFQRLFEPRCGNLTDYCVYRNDIGLTKKNNFCKFWFLSRLYGHSVDYKIIYQQYFCSVEVFFFFLFLVYFLTKNVYWYISLFFLRIISYIILKNLYLFSGWA